MAVSLAPLPDAADGQSFADRDALIGIDDWSFASLKPSETLWGPHGYHRYPAKFIPQLVRRLIDCFSDQDGLVGDTFVGSATTGIEALRAGRRFWGGDVNPVALLIGRAKCIPLEPAALNAAWAALDRHLAGIERIGRRQLTKGEKDAILAIDIARASDEERLRYWFPATQRQALGRILDEVMAEPGDSVRTFFLCAFSNTLRRSSIWLSGSTKPQKDLTKYLADPTDAFRMQVRDMVRRNAVYWADLRAAGLDPTGVADRCHIVHDDARHLGLANAELDLLVTSPPYATCYEYSHLHQLTHLWFKHCRILPPGIGHSAFIGTKEVSARDKVADIMERSTGSDKANAALKQLAALATDKDSHIRREVRQLRYYFHDMQTAIKESARVLAENKRMVLIIGDSRKRGVMIPTSAALCDMAVAAGFTLEHRIVRKIPARVLTSTRNQATGRFSSAASSDSRAYPEEDILVFVRRRREDKADE